MNIPHTFMVRNIGIFNVGLSNILVGLYTLNTITRFYFCQIFFIIRLQDPPRHSFLCRIPCMKIMPFKICNSFKGIICISSKAYNFFSSQKGNAATLYEFNNNEQFQKNSLRQNICHHCFTH